MYLVSKHLLRACFLPGPLPGTVSTKAYTSAAAWGECQEVREAPALILPLPLSDCPFTLGLDTNNRRGGGSSPNPFNVLRRTRTGKGASKTADLQCEYHLQPGRSFVICLPFSLNAAVRQQLQLLEEGSYLLPHLMSSEDICTHISLPFSLSRTFSSNPLV